MMLRLFLGHRIELELSQTERRIAWAFAVVLLLVNWFYIILCIG